MARTPGPHRELRGATVRESLREALLEEPCTARDLSRAVGIPEREVPEHLEHLMRSLPHRGEALEVEPCRCLDCGFVPRRHPLKRPGHCPECRGRRLSLPRFRIEARSGRRPGRPKGSRRRDRQERDV